MSRYGVEPKVGLCDATSNAVNVLQTYGHRKRKILNKYGLFGKGCNGSTGLVYRDTFKPQNFGNIVHYTDETKVQMFGHLVKTKHDISAQTAHNTCQAQRRRGEDLGFFYSDHNQSILEPNMRPCWKKIKILQSPKVYTSTQLKCCGTTSRVLCINECLQTSIN